MNAERMRNVYKECLRNHAASLGTYAVDGCCEFILDASNPGLLQCAACGCHRNFHRRATDNYNPLHNKLGLDGQWVQQPNLFQLDQDGRRRQRTKFSVSQKVRMANFAEKIGWKIPRLDGGEEENEVSKFCSDIGVSRQVFKVWIHNHKNNAAAAALMASSTPDDIAAITGALTPDDHHVTAEAMDQGNE